MNTVGCLSHSRFRQNGHYPHLVDAHASRPGTAQPE
jgi:hypothetical protein